MAACRSRVLALTALVACRGSSSIAHADAGAAPKAVVDAALVVAAPDAQVVKLAEGHDFTPEALALYRVAACGGGDALPDGVDAKLVDAHCKTIAAARKKFVDDYAAVAAPYLAKLRPASLPATVVYPFGGGDLLFALLVYPDATDITTISLERAGDPRAIDAPKPKRLAAGLADARWMYAWLAGVEYSLTSKMIEMQRSPLPVVLDMSLAALATYGYEPVSLRYFTIAADGSERYVTDEDLAAVKPAPAKTPHVLDGHGLEVGVPTTFSDMELTFRPVGGGQVRTYRHIAANVDDPHLAKDPSLLAWLGTKGRVAAMTKAASFLLWRPEFHTIRDWLLGHMDFMISDATGILPAPAAKAGFTQEGHGRFGGALLAIAPAKGNAEMIAFWKTQPKETLPFLFGYPDRSHTTGHLLVTRRQER